MLRFLQHRGKSLLKQGLARAGYRLSRLSDEDRLYADGGYDPSMPLPADAARRLAADHPRLQELRERYRRFDSPVVRHTMWDERYRRIDLDLRYFRGDNVYVWQYRSLRAQARLKNYIYARYLQDIDVRGLVRQLGEDGAFGCFSFTFDAFGTVSRDLLDSVNELYFLDRAMGLFARDDLRVLDIGAGYGRMAHRMVRAHPQLAHYWCIDAVPESTFLCEYYVEHRGLADRVSVLPADQMDRLTPGSIDLALNIHSFSEMNLATVTAWLDWLVKLQVPKLMIVPNDGARLLAWHSDAQRPDFAPLLAERGFRLTHDEACWRDADVARLIGKPEPDHLLLFERA